MYATLCFSVLPLVQAFLRDSSTPITDETAHIGHTTTIASATVVDTLTAASTRACNGYQEFCSRRYSNITYVGTHNSPFDAPNNLASNQDADVISQLNSGIRMLQGQTHVVNGVVYYCHTSCDLLNAGTASAYFTNITSWLAANPFEVLTILIANGDYVSVANFTPAIESSGLSSYAYQPPAHPMHLQEWPTLGDLITQNKRAIIFMDYNANQSTIPYILDEFSQIWETLMDPTNQSFSCAIQRPPELIDAQKPDIMYLMNHNLDLTLTIAGTEIVVPDIARLNETNAISGIGSLGMAANNCAATWGIPPNFLLVDYYNAINGSVFQVAAQLNGVTYDATPISTAVPTNTTPEIPPPGGTLPSVLQSTPPSVVPSTVAFISGTTRLQVRNRLLLAYSALALFLL